MFRTPPSSRLTAVPAVRYTLTPFHEAALCFYTLDRKLSSAVSSQSMRFAGSRWHSQRQRQKLPQTRIDSMEVYESPLHSLMTGTRFQPDHMFDAHTRLERRCLTIAWSAIMRQRLLRKVGSVQKKALTPRCFSALRCLCAAFRHTGSCPRDGYRPGWCRRHREIHHIRH